MTYAITPVSNATPYDPFAPENILIGLVDAINHRPDHPLADLTPVKGAGVYLIYYLGIHQSFDAYESLTKPNQDELRVPIYVGKAVPKGARKGQRRKTVEEDEAAASLATRLNNHRVSIEHADNLDVRDFQYRYLPVKAFWIPTMERLLIEHYAPLWNQVVDGFGNKAQGSERGTTAPSPWDTIHPGRLKNLNKRKKRRLSRDQVVALINHALARSSAPMEAETAITTEIMSSE